jgi:uncharacterized protein (TIGR01319 family)
MQSTVLLIDFGSTFTKVTAVDCDTPAIIGRAQAPTTIDTDVALGLDQAIARLVEQAGRAELRNASRIASSSAAGGLRLVVCGLVPRLTSEAARRAALGAGAKIVGRYSYTLSRADVAEIERLAPDILLLAGGTDGGDAKVVIDNARSFAASRIDCPFVVAANRAAADDVVEILARGGKTVRKVANVMPEFGRLEVEGAREAIREVFIERIVKAKGLDRVQQTMARPIIPTPMAVLQGAELLAKGHGSESGMGDLMLVDVGGATTDVDSIASGDPTDPSVMARGLPEPYAKRTVEGDLGIRFNAGHILESAGAPTLMQHARIGEEESTRVDLAGHVATLGARVQTLPDSDAGYRIDTALARAAVEIAVRRHAGAIEHVHMVDGDVAIQTGKDLRNVAVVVGTGGILAHGRNPRYVIEGACYSDRDPLSLRPRAPELLVDTEYIFYAMGLLAAAAPEVAVRLQKRSLKSA